MSISSFFPIPDLYISLESNAFLFTNFSFFWTSFLYLPYFFFSYLALFILQAQLITYTATLPLLVAFTIYLVELTDFLTTNATLEGVNFVFFQLNPLLANILNNYHPGILYTGVALTVLTWFCVEVTSFLNVRKASLNYFNERLFRPNSVLLCNFIALTLGAWWALQEGTWGGWWSWDPSEVFGLMFLVLSLPTLHITGGLFREFRFFYRLRLFLLSTILAYLLIQLNFEIISHNFGIKFFFFFNNNLFLLESLLILLTVALVLISSAVNLGVTSVLTTTGGSSFLSQTSFGSLTNVSAYSVLLYYVLIGFYPTVQYFLDIYLNVNLLHTVNPFLLLSLFYNVWFSGISQTFNSILAPANRYGHGTGFNSPPLSMFGAISWIHNLILLFLLLNTLATYFTLSLPLAIPPTHELALLQTTFSPALPTYQLNGPLVDAGLILQSWLPVRLFPMSFLLCESNSIFGISFFFLFSSTVQLSLYVTNLPNTLLYLLGENGFLLHFPLILCCIICYLPYLSSR